VELRLVEVGVGVPVVGLFGLASWKELVPSIDYCLCLLLRRRVPSLEYVYVDEIGIS